MRYKYKTVSKEEFYVSFRFDAKLYDGLCILNAFTFALQRRGEVMCKTILATTIRSAPSLFIPLAFTIYK